MIRRGVVIALCSLVVALLPMAVHAAGTAGKGLYISPLRQQLTLRPGVPLPVTVTVGNLTDKPMKVDLNVKQFSVADYTYSYTFRPLEYDWVKLADTSATLQPGQKQQMRVTVTAPKDAATGGYYFALFASTLMTDRGVRSTVQAASLLYTQVDGRDARRSVEVLSAHTPPVVTGAEIPYKFDVKNTGNVHVSGQFFARLDSPWGAPTTVGTNHIVLPGTTRTISGSVLTPALPWVYRVTYGYTDELTGSVVTKTTNVLFIPPWFFVAVFMALLAGNYWRRERRRAAANG